MLELLGKTIIVLGTLSVIVLIFSDFFTKKIIKFLDVGYLKDVKNKNRAFGSAKDYRIITVLDCRTGNLRRLALTDHDVKVLNNRAIKNPEDFQ